MSPTKAVTVQDVLAERVREVRERRGYSLRELSRRLRDLGHPMDASTLMRLENRERHATIEDVLALALALDVAPVNLIVPLDNDVRFRLATRNIAAAGPVRAWVRGDPATEPIRGVDYDRYRRETPAVRWEERTGFQERVEQLYAEEQDAEEAGDVKREHAAGLERVQLIHTRRRVAQGHIDKRS